MQKLTITHVRNWQENRHRVGYGHLYQGRYKSFPVESDDYFYQVVRYVERNALRANLVTRAEKIGAGAACGAGCSLAAEDRRPLSPWPLPRPRNWAELVSQPQTEAELEAIRRSLTRGQPLRKRDLGEEDGRTVGTGIDPPSSRPAAEKGILKHIRPMN